MSSSALYRDTLVSIAISISRAWDF